MPDPDRRKADGRKDEEVADQLAEKKIDGHGYAPDPCRSNDRRQSGQSSCSPFDWAVICGDQQNEINDRRNHGGGQAGQPGDVVISHVFLLGFAGKELAVERGVDQEIVSAEQVEQLAGGVLAAGLK